SVSANAVTRGKPAQKNSVATVTMAKVVASGEGAYVLPKDGSGVYQWSPGRVAWRKVGGPAKNLYAGMDTVYATNPDTGDVWRYNGKPNDWTRISGPVADLAATNKHLYKIPADRSGVWEYTGPGDKWRPVGGPAAHLYAYTGKTKAMKNAEKQRGGAQGLLTDSPLFATDPASGNIAHYLGGPDKWSVIGQPGAEFAVTDETLYGLSPDHSGIWQWNGKDGKASNWANVRTERTEHIIASDTLFAINPGTGDIAKHNGNGNWAKIGGPATAFATSGGQLYRLSPDGTGLYRYTWDKQNNWAAAGAPAAPATQAEKIAALDRMVQVGPAAADEYYKALGDHRQGRPDRYEFNWSTNICNSPAPNTPAGFDFTQACVRHDFGYRNYRELLGEGGFRFNGRTGLGLSPKDRVDQVFLQDLNEVCDAPSWPVQRTTPERDACHKFAKTYWGGVVARG
ncbi:phospholipase A2, partial [Kitasatospora sp. NPDC127111]|uniref:phospholipase A2 n=1 Tax=Kitasatospora sp. NPDC127111 TaxID=3345363 RepID=UPI00362DB067